MICYSYYISVLSCRFTHLLLILLHFNVVIGLQIPGSRNQFDGVFNTLVETAKHEGLKGLYRLEISNML